MTASGFLTRLYIEEDRSNCYEAKIHGISAYTLLRQEFRKKMLASSGCETLQLKGSFRKSSVIPILLSSLKSLYQMIQLLIMGKNFPIVFLPFPRIEKINGVFVEKFTDPLIDIAAIEVPYIILETGRMGVHQKPRAHEEKVVNIDFIRFFAKLLSQIDYVWFKNKYRKELLTLMKSLNVLSKAEVKKNTIIKQLLSQYVEVNLYKFLFKRLRTTSVIAPTRPQEPFIAAHLVKASVFELQHGITYDETVLYSGYRDPLLVPDRFLAFGNNKPSNVYGIDERCIVNIGFALMDYINQNSLTENEGKISVLVVSDPEITNVITDVVAKLAHDNPHITFAFRPHPHEIISEENMRKFINLSNVYIQDNKINIIEVLLTFNLVIGENSTVLYEALSMNKKVGKLFYKGLDPKYLVEEDKESFWEIKNQNDFKRFLNEDISTKKSKCIYSKFDKGLFLKVIGIDS